MSEIERPRDVQLFETIQIVLIALNVITEFKNGDDSPFYLIASVGFSFALMLLASRRRRNWARLILAANLFVWCLLWIYPIDGKATPNLIAIIQILGEAISVGLLFTTPSNAWFARRSDA